MEGKVVIMSVVLVSLVVVLGQIQVEAQSGEACCKDSHDKNIFNTCRFAGGSQSMCASLSGCTLSACPPGWILTKMLQTSVNEYCKSGCVSSVCGAITTLQDSDASEVVKGAVEKCSNACSDYCNKGSVITSAVGTTA